MAGYILQGQTGSGEIIDIPLSATYDGGGNKIVDTYADMSEYRRVMDKLAGMSDKLEMIVGATSLSLASWELIDKISSMGIASSFWKVGDEKEIELTTGEKVTMVILGFNHDDLTGGGKAGITFGVKNCLSEHYGMNDNTNVGGWRSCEMRVYTLDMIYDYLPEDVKAVIKPVDKRTTAGAQSSEIDITSDKLFLFSLEEVMGTCFRSSQDISSFFGEGTQYEYFKTAPIPKPVKGDAFSVLEGTGCFYTTDTSTVTDYVNIFGETETTRQNYYYNYYASKATGDSGERAEFWWLRSPYYLNNVCFCLIDETGKCYNDLGSVMPIGLVFGFCV